MTDPRRVLAAGALAATVLLGAGCSVGSTGSDTAEAVQGTLEMRGHDVDDVSCDDGLAADDDSTTCTVTVGGKDYPVEVRAAGSGNGGGNDIEFDDSSIPKK